MPRVLTILIGILILTGCAASADQAISVNDAGSSASYDAEPQEDGKNRPEISEAIQAYLDFLAGTKGAYDGETASFCDEDFIRADGTVSFTLVDMTNDGIPELHVMGRITYWIIQWENEQLTLWYQGTAYEKLLNNHAILYSREGAGCEYQYIEPQKNGSDQRVYFSVINSSDGLDYYFEDRARSKEVWEDLVTPYLTIGDDEIQWLTLTVPEIR